MQSQKRRQSCPSRSALDKPHSKMSHAFVVGAAAPFDFDFADGYSSEKACILSEGECVRRSIVRYYRANAIIAVTPFLSTPALETSGLRRSGTLGYRSSWR